MLYCAVVLSWGRISAELAAHKRQDGGCVTKECRVDEDAVQTSADERKEKESV